MTAGLLIPFARRRPTPGALYVGGVAVFALLVLALTGARAMDPVAVALIGVPLGPLGVIAAAIALPLFAAPPSLPLAALIVAGALAIAVVNVLVATLITRATAGEPVLRR